MNGNEVDYLTIETHCKPSIENSHKNLLQITNMLEDLEMEENLIVK